MCNVEALTFKGDLVANLKSMFSGGACKFIIMLQDFTGGLSTLGGPGDVSDLIGPAPFDTDIHGLSWDEQEYVTPRRDIHVAVCIWRPHK